MKCACFTCKRIVFHYKQGLGLFLVMIYSNKGWQIWVSVVNMCHHFCFVHNEYSFRVVTFTATSVAQSTILVDFPNTPDPTSQVTPSSDVFRLYLSSLLTGHSSKTELLWYRSLWEEQSPDDAVGLVWKCVWKPSEDKIEWLFLTGGLHNSFDNSNALFLVCTNLDHVWANSVFLCSNSLRAFLTISLLLTVILRLLLLFRSLFRCVLLQVVLTSDLMSSISLCLCPRSNPYPKVCMHIKILPNVGIPSIFLAHEFDCAWLFHCSSSE